jgi:hypothetical protein
MVRLITVFILLSVSLSLPQLHEYWGDLFATIVLSTVLYLMFEAPFILVENYFHEKFTRKQKNDEGKV